MASRYVARFINRNPRNHEMMCRQVMPSGYQFEVEAERMKRNFIYRVELIQSKAHQEARIVHYKDGVVVTVSTKEPSINNQLYSNTDTCAAMNLGHVLAMRCLRSGIHFALPTATSDEIERSKHQAQFIAALKDGGLQLDAPPVEEHSYKNDKRFTWERYPLKNTRQDKLDEL